MTSVEAVMSKGYPSYHEPFAIARDWLRDGSRRADALNLLTYLRQKYPHILPIGSELVLALLENDRPGDALAELDRLERQFGEIDEETRCRWGRIFKNRGDQAWQKRDYPLAEKRYKEALEQYTRAFAERAGHYPGINKATLSFLLAALARLRDDWEEDCKDYLRRSEATARELLGTRTGWPHDFPDDAIWHAATEGEAYLLLRRWPEAADAYGRALSNRGIQPFHRRVMRLQVQRIRDAFTMLGVACEKPFDDLDALFGQTDGI